MRAIWLGVFLVLASSVTAAAQSGSSYDWQSGNSYHWNNSGGQTHVYGYNSNTGSNWNTNIQRNGDMNGVDGSGNYWNYNAQSGSYYNSDGTVCSGKGAWRVCN